MEYHHKIGTSKSQLADFLRTFENAGYEYNIDSHFNKLGLFQDIIIYFYKP
jgi:hypothetical protein